LNKNTLTRIEARATWTPQTSAKNPLICSNLRSSSLRNIRCLVAR